MFFFVCISMLVGNLAPLLVALGFGLCSSPVFLIGWGIINMREYALRAEINPLQAKLEHLSKPEDVRLAVDVQVLDLKLNEANGAHRLFPSTSCLRAEDVSGLNQIERVGLESWVEWREDLGEDLRQVFDSITCIVAVTRLKQASERASGLLQNVNDISRDLGHQSPPEIPKLNELVAGFHKMQDSGPIEEQVHAGGDNQGDALPAGPFAVPPGSITNSIGMQLVPIPVGEFLMGSAEDCPLGDPDEEFQHRVRISKPFLLGMHQVTQRQYERVTGENPSHFKGNELPVEHLSWKEALRFCEMLSSLPAERQACRRYRLPTEAEWEFACRAGTTTPFNTGHTLKPDQARFSSTSRSSPRQTATVGSYQPNAWGIFDMHGNVWEWTADWFSADYFRESPVDDPQGPATGTHHTLRGGSASVNVQECRTTIRGESPTDGPDGNGQRYPLYGDFGVRVVCEASTVAADEPDGAIHHRVGPTLFDLKTEIVAPNHPCKDTDLQRLDSVSGVDDLRDVPADDCSAAILISDALTLLAAADKQVGSAEIQAIAHIISTFRVVVSGEDNINRIKQAVAEIKARGVAVFANTVRDRLTPHRGTQFLDDLLKAMVDLSKRDGAAHENEMRVINWFNQQLGDKAL